MDIIPYFSELSKQGESGRVKLNQITKYMGIALAFIPMLIVEMLVFAFPELFNSEILAGLQPDALMEYFKSMF